MSEHAFHCLARSAGRRLRFEALEDRRVLATFTVTNLNDAPVAAPDTAPGTLRQAIYDANNSPGADLIEFASNLSGSVELSAIDDATQGQSALRVSSEIMIRGNSNGITISRSGSAAEMRLFLVTADGNLTLETISLTGGIARGADGTSAGQEGSIGQGGAILSQGVVAIVSSTIYANQAVGGHGGAGARGGAGQGGAIYSDQGTLLVTNSTFSGNAVYSGMTSTTSNASSFGGGIYTRNGMLTVRNSTITLSTATSGRGIYVLADGTATVEIRSSIIGQSGFVAAQVREFLTAATVGEEQFIVSGSNNLIRSQSEFHNITISTDDPLLGELANNGGPTLTHALTAASPAVDLGINSLSLPADQRGGSYSRVVGPAADIGAYELQTALLPVLPGDYNGNHIVDAADYVLWRKMQGTSVPQYSGADGDGDSTVDDADYGVWRGNFGSMPPPGSGAASSDLAPGMIASTATFSQNWAELTSGSISVSPTESQMPQPEKVRALDFALRVPRLTQLGRNGKRLPTSRRASQISDRARDRVLASILMGGRRCVGDRLPQLDDERLQSRLTPREGVEVEFNSADEAFALAQNERRLEFVRTASGISFYSLSNLNMLMR